MRRNEDAYLDDDQVVPDGGSVKVPIYLMDGVQRGIAANSHGQLSDELLQLRARTRAAYDQQLTNAWRGPAQRVTPDRGLVVTTKPTHHADADPQRSRMAAYDEMVHRISNAWHTPNEASPRDAAPDDPDKLDDLMRRHLEPDDPDDAQARRDAAWASYRDRLGNAWKTNPNVASAIERQAERWRGGR